MFITFEGPDGSGKTTQILRLTEHLRSLGYEVERTREPGGTAISDHIRSILLSPEHVQMADQTEILLYAAARAQHVHEKILPLLASGKIVLCDRFIDASVAYQGYGLDVDPALVEQISLFATAGLEPKRTYMLDIKPEAGRERILRRAELAGQAVGEALDRIERKPLAYHEKVRAGFHEIADFSNDRVLRIDADRDADLIFADILDDCLKLLKEVDVDED